MTPVPGKMLGQEWNGGLERRPGVGVEITQPLAGLPALPPASCVIWASYLRLYFSLLICTMGTIPASTGRGCWGGLRETIEGKSVRLCECAHRHVGERQAALRGLPSQDPLSYSFPP